MKVMDMTPPSLKLLVGIAAQPLESFESMMFRSAAANGLAGIALMERRLQVSVMEPVSFGSLEWLRECIGMDMRAAELAVPLAIDGGIALSGVPLEFQHVALTSRRVCGQCVAAHGYGYSYWSLSPLAVCGTHGTALIDCCPVCRAPFVSSRPGYTVCRCGTDCRNIQSQSAPEAAVHVARLLEARFRAEKMPASGTLGFPDARLEPLGLGELLDLVIFLGALHHDARTVSMRKLSGPVSLRTALPKLERAGRALADWPNGFYAVLRGARSYFPASESAADVARSLDHVVQLAVNCLQAERLGFVTQGIAAFLADPSEWNAARARYRGEAWEGGKC